jgi:hypothetical protein
LVHEEALRSSVSLDDGLLKLSSEDALDLIEKWSAGINRSWQLSKLHVVSGAPEEALLGKVLLSEIVDSKSNVVVSQDTCITVRQKD